MGITALQDTLLCCLGYWVTPGGIYHVFSNIRASFGGIGNCPAPPLNSPVAVRLIIGISPVEFGYVLLYNERDRCVEMH